MADPAPTNVPTITPAILQQMQAWFAANQSGAPPSAVNGQTGALTYPGVGGPANASQGAGQSYTSMIPVYLQGGISPPPGADPVFDWLTQNGYLTGGGGGGVSPGWRSEGLTGQTVQKGQTTLSQLSASGAYDPTQDVGSGYGVGNNLLETPNNPYGVSTMGAQDIHAILSPTQAPGAFGTGAFGDPTVNKGDVTSNQDFWSKYGTPIMELLAGAAFGEVGGFGDLGTLGKSLFGTGGSDILNSGNGQSTINPEQFLPVIMKMLGQG